MTEEGNQRSVLPLMIGTAGHVDHGKTSLVKNLTGHDTDRLKEEKLRGLSIDFGVAPLSLPNGAVAGLIDVPGHEDFIRNTVAGASSIDLLLLVIAADDSVMPQTREHLRIAQLLEVSKIIVVLTKIDLVDAEMRELVSEDVRSLLEEMGFSDVPFVEVSNTTLEGIEELKTSLAAATTGVEREPDTRAFRMYTRHVFTKKGYGTVVTGVPCAGELKVGEQLELLPEGRATGVRAIQTYSKDADHTAAHTSSAINLRDLDIDDISRGMCLASPGVYSAPQRILVKLRNNSDSHSLKRRTAVRFLLGTASVVARLKLLDSDSLGPGEQTFASLILQEPTVVAAGDFFVVRALSPALTIGGGRVLSISPGSRVRRNNEAIIARLTQAEAAIAANDFFFSEVLARRNAVFSAEELLQLSQGRVAEAKAHIAQAIEAKVLLQLDERHWLLTERLAEVRSFVKKALARYHRANKLTWGMKPSYVSEILGLPVETKTVLKELLGQDPEITIRHGLFGLVSFKPEISAKEIKLCSQIIEQLEAAGANPVAQGNLKDELQMSNAEFKTVSKILVGEGKIFVLGTNVFAAAVVESAKTLLLKLFQSSEQVELKIFRDTLEISRNGAVALLEHFDSIGLTRRQGNSRILNKKK